MDRAREVCSVALGAAQGRRAAGPAAAAALTVRADDADALRAVPRHRRRRGQRPRGPARRPRRREVGFGVSQRLAVNARAAGPRLGKDVQTVIKGSKSGDWSVGADGVVTSWRASRCRTASTRSRRVVEGGGDAGPGHAALPGGGFVVLDTTLTPELEAEGLARDVVRAVQQARRDAGLDISDRIRLTVAAERRRCGRPSSPTSDWSWPRPWPSSSARPATSTPCRSATASSRRPPATAWPSGSRSSAIDAEPWIDGLRSARPSTGRPAAAHPVRSARPATWPPTYASRSPAPGYVAMGLAKWSESSASTLPAIRAGPHADRRRRRATVVGVGQRRRLTTAPRAVEARRRGPAATSPVSGPTPRSGHRGRQQRRAPTHRLGYIHWATVQPGRSSRPQRVRRGHREPRIGLGPTHLESRPGPRSGDRAGRPDVPAAAPRRTPTLPDAPGRGGDPRPRPPSTT